MHLLQVATLACLPSLSCGQGMLTIGREATLATVLQALDSRTPPVIEVAPGDAELARSYRFPPHLVGQKVPLSSARAGLDYLCGKGWEGSPLPQDLRTTINLMLARCPYRPDWEPGLWVCNNACWTWKWEKVKGGPAGGIIHVSRALQPDGDVVTTEPFSLAPLRDEFALNELLAMVKQKTRTVVNVDGNQYASVPSPGDGKPRLEPMRVRDLPSPLREKLAEPHTLGEFLTLLAVGLNARTKDQHGLWKWSSDLPPKESGAQSVIYTLRDYGNQ